MARTRNSISLLHFILRNQQLVNIYCRVLELSFNIINLCFYMGWVSTPYLIKGTIITFSHFISIIYWSFITIFCHFIGFWNESASISVRSLYLETCYWFLQHYKHFGFVVGCISEKDVVIVLTNHIYAIETLKDSK